MIPEKEREALMRLTMCAREECGMCKYKDTCGFDFQYETATRCMNILADALRKLNSSEKPNNCEDEPRKEQNFCGKCRYLYRDFKYGLSCYRLMDNEPCKYEERKDEPQTDCAWK